MENTRPEIIFVDELIDTIRYWSLTATKSLYCESGNDLWCRHPAALDNLRDKLVNNVGGKDAELVIQDILIGLTHSILVAFDGGTKMADVLNLRMVDQNNVLLPTNLHEIFSDRLLARQINSNHE